MPAVKKIVIIGPESTGKSSLTEQLAVAFGVYSSPEYAREYLTEHGMDYHFADLMTIARGQVQLEDRFYHLAIEAGHQLVFFDTDLYVMKVWSEFVFEKCDAWILDQIVERPADLYLLCSTDIPWVSDPLREYPDLENREKLFHIYKDILINQSVPWVEIKGNYTERFEQARAAVQTLALPF